MTDQKVLPRRGKDLTGLTFGRLTVTEFAGIRSGKKESLWKCRCECGDDVVVKAAHLSGGNTRSCGCLARETTINRSTVHGGYGSGEYRSWQSMISRCERALDHAYSSYGGRGICVCKRWRHSFEAFLEDMGPRPSKLHSIDRIDNDGHYEPTNCRWATKKQQSRNRGNNRLLTCNGQTMPMSAWAETMGHRDRTVIHSRLKAGWSAEDAILTPVRRCVQQVKLS